MTPIEPCTHINSAVYVNFERSKLICIYSPICDIRFVRADEPKSANANSVHVQAHVADFNLAVERHTAKPPNLIPHQIFRLYSI